MGPVGSDNWHAMLDGAEDILREEGHAELTSRRIAERIGVKQRLIYYYFHTMDDLVVALFHRLSERELAKLREAARSAPLRELWDASVRTTDARLISEFMALANRTETLKSEVIHFIEEARSIQIEAVNTAIARSSEKSKLPVAGLAVIATSLALLLNRENELGVTLGHEEVKGIIRDFFAGLDN